MFDFTRHAFSIVEATSMHYDRLSLKQMFLCKSFFPSFLICHIGRFSKMCLKKLSEKFERGFLFFLPEFSGDFDSASV